jgi:hypothetical protein
MTTIQARVQKILGEVAEARRAEAEALVRRFGEDEQVAVAEILADAHKAEVFDSAKARLQELIGKDFTGREFFDIYRSLGLVPSGAERS